MKKIKTEDEFEKVLLLEKAMVFIFFEWSGQAHMSKRILSEWENKSELNFPLFELEPDELMSVSKWVREEAKERGGYGSLVWLENGRVLSIEMNVGNSGISEIERKTAELFN